MNPQSGPGGRAPAAPRGRTRAAPPFRTWPRRPGAAQPDLRISTAIRGSGYVVEVAGEVDMATEARFDDAVAEALRANEGGRVVLHLAELRFIDSSGLGVLIRAHKIAAAQRTALVIAAPTRMVAQVLRVTSLDTRIPVFASLATALDPSPAE